MITATVKDNLLVSLAQMIARVQQTSGMSEEQVVTLLGTYFASDVEAIDKANVTHLLTPKGGYLAAKAAIDEWVGASPELLNTIQEIAEALNGDPDAFNTLMTAINENKVKVLELESRQMVLFDTDTRFFGRTALAMEDVPLGIYHGQAAVATLGTVPADTLDPLKPVSLTVKAVSYWNTETASEDITVGEEDRKLFSYDVRQGNKVVAGFLDTRMGGTAVVTWAVVSNPDAAIDPISGEYITPVLITDFIDVVTLRARDNGQYFVAIQSNIPAWLEVDTYLPGATTVAVLVTLRNDEINAAEKIATYSVIGESGTYHIVFSTFTGIKQFVEIATKGEVVDLVTDVYHDMEVAFSRVGHTAGSAVVAFAKQYNVTNTDAVTATIAFAVDGTYEVVADRVVLGSGYWLPYGALATEYQIKRTDTVGEADAESTLSTSFAAFPADKANATLAVTQLVDGANLVTSNITIKHVPSSKETTGAVTLNVVNAA